jgi:CDP-glucose 4,6-dehydratase
LKHIFLTGHTGFKGTWFAYLLRELGFEVSGYSDAVKPGGVFEQTQAHEIFRNHIIGDIRDGDALTKALNTSDYDSVVHLAAQPIVISSFENPEETFDVNARGTWSAVLRATDVGIRKMLVVTTDKVYKNALKKVAHAEDSPLGGFDPYAGSKAAADLITQSLADTLGPAFRIHVARAGNVIGGGDTSPYRIVPDIETAISSGRDLKLRNGDQVRPWQHVLDCLDGYLAILNADKDSSTWNVGPTPGDSSISVLELVRKYLGCRNCSVNLSSETAKFVETDYLQLDTNKIQKELAWKPKWDTEKAIQKTADWYNLIEDGLQPREAIKRQIQSYLRG